MTRPSAYRALAGILALAVGLAACGGPSGPRVTYPPIGATTPPVGGAAAQARQAVTSALGAVGYQVGDAVQAYRPAEGARLAGAARTVVSVLLATDPDHGRIVIYELATPGDAQTAAEEQADYVASGVGRVQFPSGTRFVIRVVGAAVVFFAWSAENTTDPEAMAAVADALATIGSGVAVPG